jgi:hypothetical protein
MQTMHLILDFQDDKFSINEVEKPNLNIESFFNFHKKMKNFSLSDLVKFGISKIQELHDLSLRGYITLEAKEEIKKRLSVN